MGRLETVRAARPVFTHNVGDRARQKGSHIQLKHRDKPHYLVTIPYHNKDLATGTLVSIIKQMGLTKEKFEELLK
jgi:hypothetical protein